jgi:hypothetical protein
MGYELRQAFKKQLETNPTITDRIYNSLKLKTYHNGEKIRVGDLMLYGFLEGEITKTENYGKSIVLTLINLKESHFNLYSLVRANRVVKSNHIEIPSIKLKQ